ncbi:hypothetical protein [uncultured Chryseobacterium sp.]|uniref:hypothetical protein n=1 Tax=uncultured Chryseobacterium sp. TaxID=259322 RepID=UPI0025DF7C83|nr:hypothetical protein [uncultured Chryseobacterium sp.]
MNTKLDNVTTQYRKFNENQALTEGQLNEFIDYFEDQDRLSRTRLSGVGIVCGFKSTLADSLDTIVVTQGAGITTDGDLITLRQKTGKASEVTINFDAGNYKYYREYTDVAGYKNFQINGTQIPLLELFTQEEYNQMIDVRRVKSISEIANLKNQIVILYLESYSNEETPCQDADCDNTGAEQVSNLKVLLADSRAVADLLAKGDAKDSLYKVHNGYQDLFDNLPPLEAKRVILNSGITTAGNLKTIFQDAIDDVTRLCNGFNAVAETFNVSPDLRGDALITKVKSVLKPVTSNLEDYQYRYGLFKDLIDTYNEIKGLILHLNVDCCPDIASFPKHLMLGAVGATLELGAHTPYRHDFYHSPITTDHDENYERIIMLANRFVQKLKAFQSYAGPVKITPSHLNERLGEKAIPYYYIVDQPLLRKWNFEKTKTDTETYNLSYHTANLSSADFIQNPLDYTIDDNDFYRIEGFLGMPFETAVQNINDLKAKYGLAFDVIVLLLQKGGRGNGDTGTQKVSIEELRKQLVSISSAISKETGDAKSTLLNLSRLDSQLRLLNKADFSSASGEEITVIKQDTKKDKISTELLSNFLERKSGLEHLAGVERGGTFVLICESETNNQVLADFSLPYLCCSKKDPVFLTLPAGKLCQRDKAIAMTIVPADGEVKAMVNGVQIPAVTQSAGQSFFDPGLVSAAYLGQTIIFTVNDEPVEAQMVVNAQPNVTLTIADTVYNYASNEATVYFKVVNNGSGSISSYQWNYGDGHTDTLVPNFSNLVSHVFPIVPNENTTYHTNLNVIAENSGCSTQVTVDVELSGLQLVSCSDNFNYSGSVGTFEYNIDFGTDTGMAGINYNAYTVPDRFIIEWNGQKYDSGFVGSSTYNSSLISKGVNPADIKTANPSNGAGSLKFNKTSALPRYAKVTVLAPLGSTAWNVSGICPSK